MLFALLDRTPSVSGVAGLALAMCLAGCASKNPLMEEPAVPAAAGKPVEAASAQAATATNTPTSGVTSTGPTGVQRFLGVFSPYRVDIQQGNFVSREMVAQLKEGMQRPEGVTREQVRFVLGTPLLTDIFHADRWDYVFRLKKRTGEVLSSRVSVFFKDNRLASIDGGTLPTEQEYLAFIAGSKPAK
ncbi:outer membrane protein assembly factor BamE [Noviherbaspirillum saxi]|uniref:Outer membrane protein assembly factor BamE n=1 Tax=Noviherbaspirillum saxi TaxID=2320863 RepID=A0A3A3FUU6_9BURK|nr:outer membrane protein assembly factor BamE [Noviherbaspirillum saxi]